MRRRNRSSRRRSLSQARRGRRRSQSPMMIWMMRGIECTTFQCRWFLRKRRRERVPRRPKRRQEWLLKKNERWWRSLVETRESFIMNTWGYCQRLRNRISGKGRSRSVMRRGELKRSFMIRLRSKPLLQMLDQDINGHQKATRLQSLKKIREHLKSHRRNQLSTERSLRLLQRSSSHIGDQKSESMTLQFLK